jgi:hypothetical protein
VVILLGMIRLKTDISDRLVAEYDTARVLTAGQLVLLGVATAIVVGL